MYAQFSLPRMIHLEVGIEGGDTLCVFWFVVDMEDGGNSRTTTLENK